MNHTLTEPFLKALEEVNSYRRVKKKRKIKKPRLKQGQNSQRGLTWLSLIGL